MDTVAYNIQFEQVRGHWEVIVDGEFFCSADTLLEAVEEFEKTYGRN